MIVLLVALVAAHVALAAYTAREQARLVRVLAAVVAAEAPDALPLDMSSLLPTPKKRRGREPEPTVTPIGL